MTKYLRYVRYKVFAFLVNTNCAVRSWSWTVSLTIGSERAVDTWNSRLHRNFGWVKTDSIVIKIVLTGAWVSLITSRGPLTTWNVNPSVRFSR